jgi:hypothetical protein
MDGMKSHTPVGDQLIGSAVNALNQARINDEIFTLSRQDIAYELACKEMLKPRDFVASPGNILGSMSTKHGEIAEQVEVAVRNSEQAIEERLQDASTFRATFEGVGRTAPQDYLIDGMDVQSKFINGTNNNLVHVLKHMEAYPNFGKDGSFYHIPKDTWQEIQDVLDGKPVEGLKSTTIEAIKAKVAEIERQTQRPFADVVRPGSLTTRMCSWVKSTRRSTSTIRSWPNKTTRNALRSSTTISLRWPKGCAQRRWGPRWVAPLRSAPGYTANTAMAKISSVATSMPRTGRTLVWIH